MLCERIHNPDNSEAEQTVRVGVRSTFSYCFSSLADCFWSIMRTWLRDILIVIFCLGDVPRFYSFHSFRKMLFENVAV